MYIIAYISGVKGGTVRYLTRIPLNTNTGASAAGPVEHSMVDGEAANIANT